MVRLLLAIIVLSVLGVVAFVFWMIFAGFHSMESCRRFETSGTCGPMCEQVLGADDVSDSEREVACEIAAREHEADGELAEALRRLETCRGFGGCDADAVAELRCRSEPGECERRCESGEVAACLSLVDSDEHREPLGTTDTLQKLCVLEPARCGAGARRFCTHPSSPCGSACLARDNTLPELCEAAASQAQRRARVLRGIASTNELEDEIADDGTADRARAGLLDQRAQEYRTAACRLRPGCDP